MAVNESHLIIISRANPHGQFLSQITRKNVAKVVYSFENTSLDDILSFIIAELGGKKVCTVAFVVHATEKEICLAGNGNAFLSSKTILTEKNLREFFVCLSSTFMNTEKNHARIDFLCSQFKDESEATKISNALQRLTNCPVHISKDLLGSDVKANTTINNVTKTIPVMELYFLPEKLEEFLNSSMHSQIQNLSGYEKIRTVGKGAFGTAVLYRKKYDDSLVIVKEINMHDLTASERQLAINEVSVLSLLNHENIVSYYDSFEEDGLLMIEMEYADGGNLAQYLAQMRSPIEEREILLLFKQIVSAIKHMHDHNILHRDLKTANIFLTKDGTVKVGDFGISKMLTTKQGGALTVVGTPYYISPEMCEGKFYNQKSDIWALGCILYEITCQQKTFEGSNLPALVNKIVKGQFAPVKGNYSAGFKQLIRDLLQRDPDLRPTAAEILHRKLPSLLNVYEDSNEKDYDDSEISMEFNYQGHLSIGKSSVSELRSVLYDVKMHQADISLAPIPLPPRSKIKEVALSSTHMIVLTSESLVYTWGDGRKGQLGHGKLETWMEKPHCVDSLKGKNITRICAGEGFSLFSSDNGIVMTCGDGSQGCLGHSDWIMCVKPKLIEKLLSVDVHAVSCGPHHVVVVGGDGEVYSWGCGAGGRLGTGKEENCCTPTQVILPNDVKVANSYCGYDGSMFITDRGSLLACGLNNYNKLGLNEQKGFLLQMKQFIAKEKNCIEIEKLFTGLSPAILRGSTYLTIQKINRYTTLLPVLDRCFINKTEVAKQCIPTKLGWLRQKVISVSMGAMHTAILVDPGKLITFGCNKSGQLGRGNLRNSSSPAVVKSLGDRTITMVQCGDTFTIAGTCENTVYFWGSRQVLLQPQMKKNDTTSIHSKKEKSKEKRRLSDSEYISDNSETSVSEVIKIGASNSPLMAEIERIGPDSPIIQVKTPDVLMNQSPASSISSRGSTLYSDDGKNSLGDSCSVRRDVILHPKEILALYASPAQIAKGEMVSLSNLFSFGMQVFLVVDTTAPLPRSQSKPGKINESSENVAHVAQHLPPANEAKTSILEEDSLGPIPEWLKNELANAVSSNIYSKNVTTTSIGNGQESQSKTVLQNKSTYNQQNTHHIKVKPYPQDTGLTVQNKGSGRNLNNEEINMGNGCNSPVSNERELELQLEIQKLKEELKKFKDISNENVEMDQILEYKSRPNSIKGIWPRRNESRSRFRSKICSLQ